MRLFRELVAITREGLVDWRDPEGLDHAEDVLAETASSLKLALGQAEAARRRMASMQRELGRFAQATDARGSALTDRLVAIAEALARDRAQLAALDGVIATLRAAHERVQGSLHQLERDLAMARAALASVKATQQVDPSGTRGKPAGAPGFSDLREGSVLDRLRELGDLGADDGTRR